MDYAEQLRQRRAQQRAEQMLDSWLPWTKGQGWRLRVLIGFWKTERWILCRLTALATWRARRGR